MSHQFKGEERGAVTSVMLRSPERESNEGTGPFQQGQMCNSIPNYHSVCNFIPNYTSFLKMTCTIENYFILFSVRNFLRHRKHDCVRQW